MSNLLSRQAANIFWMARQIERVNNLARILDVNASFNRNNEGNQHWDVVLRLFDDSDRFTDFYANSDVDSILNFYILDPRNPSSIISNLYSARENARVLRPLISTEMWIQMNVFYNEIRETRPQDITESRLSAYCRKIKESCQTHSGITVETLYRDEAWHFYCIGEGIERADQVTRLVDVKYQALLPSMEDVGSPVDVSQWNALLRSAAGFHAYRRVHNQGMSPASVAGFLLFNQRFPRSLTRTVSDIKSGIEMLHHEHGLPSQKRTTALVDELHSSIQEDDIYKVITVGMHQYMDAKQLALAQLTSAISEEYFSGEPVT